jgi:hypothetical protein
MRLDRLPIAMVAKNATPRGKTVTLCTSLTKPSHCDSSGTEPPTFTGPPDPAVAARYAAAPEPWIDGELNQVVAIEPRFVSGIRLVGWCA